MDEDNPTLAAAVVAPIPLDAPSGTGDKNGGGGGGGCEDDFEDFFFVKKLAGTNLG